MRLIKFRNNIYTDDTHFMVSNESYSLISKFDWSVSTSVFKNSNNKTHSYRIFRNSTRKERKND